MGCLHSQLFFEFHFGMCETIKEKKRKEKKKKLGLLLFYAEHRFIIFCKSLALESNIASVLDCENKMNS